jgi:hypothetical protein
MSAPLFTRLLEKLCPHQFSWPHSGGKGQDYQVCLICGTAFAYDWSTMRRTGLLPMPVVGSDLTPEHGTPHK